MPRVRAAPPTCRQTPADRMHDGTCDRIRGARQRVRHQVLADSLDRPAQVVPVRVPVGDRPARNTLVAAVPSLDVRDFAQRADGKRPDLVARRVGLVVDSERGSFEPLRGETVGLSGDCRHLRGFLRASGI